ncbi:hypothetical protein BDV06DRAFT_213901 [Aspergillus oleicola]
MKEGITMAGPAVKIVDSPIPEPNNDQRLGRPDWAASGNIISPIREAIAKEPINQGDEIVGITEKVDSNVIEFKRGDRVAAFHEMYTLGGSHAEYAVAWSHTTFRLPTIKRGTFLTMYIESATIPLTGLTAAVSPPYANYRLPFPWRPAQFTNPLIVYGASTAVGALTIKLARNSNVHPIIAIAGIGCGYVESTVDKSKGDIVIDYRHSIEQTVSAIKSHLGKVGHSTIKHAPDAAISPESAAALNPGVRSIISVGSVHSMAGFEHNAEIAFIFCRYGNLYEVRPGGLAGIEDGLKYLKDGKPSACKYVFRIADTPGILS